MGIVLKKHTGCGKTMHFKNSCFYGHAHKKAREKFGLTLYCTVENYTVHIWFLIISKIIRAHNILYLFYFFFFQGESNSSETDVPNQFICRETWRDKQGKEFCLFQPILSLCWSFLYFPQFRTKMAVISLMEGKQNGLQLSAYPVKFIEKTIPGCVNHISLDCNSINIKL